MAQAKDVEALLWKGVFYRFIEDYRRRIRKYAAAAAAGEPLAQESLDKVCTFARFEGLRGAMLTLTPRV